MAYATYDNLALHRHWPQGVPKEMIGEALRAVFEDTIGDEYDQLAAALGALGQR